ncbi:site-specific integrase [Aurantimonas sp. 22II-16-19i]|uniref:site-specific integrase n=1 Tax=Aurantimonas sp. 22II-16-19i TaxID=1317114 RepID=UPI0009F7AB5E|nr:site-specific integrase [Aurantimonas sp. 22II-16-19i]ORE90871.1 site-specific recombinase XerD-like protein [Aurantimonas sp. 22II-16-19i]
MQTPHAKNVRIKRRYAHYLEEAERMAPTSVDQALAAIAAFEASTGGRDFAKFRIEQARRFKRQLEEQTNEKTGKPLAKSTVYARLMAVKRFVHWLAGQPGYKSKITYSDADYFNPSANDGRIATATRERPAPTIEQIRHVIETMPAGSDIEKRDRAVIAFILLTGARDDAVASLRLKHVDLDRRRLYQDAREVRTKNRKTFSSLFFPVGDDIEAIIADWIAHLKATLLFGPDDPLFPATKIGLKDGLFAPAGLDRTHWKNADSIRRIFKEGCTSAGLPYFHPHSVRRTLVQLGERVCRTPEDFKAWSQNLGHEQVLTTFVSYGTVGSDRQAAIMDSLRSGRGAGTMNDAALMEDMRRLLEKHVSMAKA